MRKKVIRVLHVGLSSNMGGIETVVHSWNCFRPDDICFDFINTEVLPLAYQEEIQSSGGRVFSIKARKHSYIKSYQQLSDIIAHNNYDYVHHHMMALSWPEPMLIASKYGVNPIAHSHTTYDQMSLKYKVLDAIGRKRLQCIDYYKLACGVEAGKDMFRQMQYRVINNGIDFAKYSYSDEARRKIREKYEIAENIKLLGHVGRQSLQKNASFILQSYAEAVKKMPNLKLMMVGNYDRDERLQTEVRDLALQEQVIFTGVQENIYEYYSAMDVFFMPSLFEGVSVALLEAQATGLPCVVSQFVPKECAIGNRVVFVDISTTAKAVKCIIDLANMGVDRRGVNLDQKYKIENTAKSIFDFYRQHLK